MNRKLTTDELKSKCTPESVTAARMILSMNHLKTIPLLLLNMLEKVQGNEKISINEWYSSKWYIEVVDRSIVYKDQVNSAVVMRLWMSVDLNSDTILDNQQKGNCGLRAIKWFRWMNKNYPQMEADIHYHKLNYSVDNL